MCTEEYICCVYVQNSLKILRNQIKNLSKSQRTQLQVSYAIDSARSRLIKGAASVLLLLAFGTFAFAAPRSWSLLDAFWFCFATLSTIGFGEVVANFTELQEHYSSSYTPNTNFVGDSIMVLYLTTILFISLGVAAVGYLFSSAVEYVSLNTIESKEEAANDSLKKWRANLRLLHGNNDINSDNESINLLFQAIDHEAESPDFTINRKEITVTVCLPTRPYAPISHIR